MIYFCIAFILSASTGGKIQGTVIDSKTGNPVADANILVLNTEIGAATDARGNFFILNVVPGRYAVEVSCMGYGPKRIENVIVEYDRAARLAVSLEPTAIELTPVTVTSERPPVSKDMVASTYLVRRHELSYLPFDYTHEFIAFQPAVARTDTALHVRGGRATEVQYIIDNVSIIDPQTGDLAIQISKGVVDEVIFLPGGFDAEYGRAMSGIINMISPHPSAALSMRFHGKTERIIPAYNDFSYENFQSSVHVPATNRIRGYFSLDVMHTDDWDPRMTILPHKQRDDYSFYTKWQYMPSGKIHFKMSGAKSRIQFDRYNTLWQFNLDHYRSDLRTGDLQALNIDFLPDTRKLFKLTLSRLYTARTYGVREPESHGCFSDYTFLPYLALRWPKASNDNPFGAYVATPYGIGHYPEYQEKSSCLYTAKVITNIQIHQHHEIRAGVEYIDQDFKNFTFFLSDSAHQIIDDYHHKPKEYTLYLQDNIDFEGVYIKAGCRYDCFSADIEGIEPKHYVSPRLGLSFEVTDRFIFRANVGTYAQPPLYDYVYSYYNLLPLPSYLHDYVPIIGNPDLSPEKTVSYEIGLQGEIKKDLSATVNTFYKDVTDLIGTRQVRLPPLHHAFLQYVNIEYANIKGIESILEFKQGIFTGKISYTLSWAKGTSSYASEFGDTTIERPATNYYLDFDQRHRVFVQGILQLPLESQVYLFGYLGNGFPYTPPGPEGKYEERNSTLMPFQKQIDCVLSKSFKFGSFGINANFEIINLLNQKNQIAPHYPLIRIEKPFQFEDFITFESNYYAPAADANHDGLVTPAEDYQSYAAIQQATDDYLNAYSPPRRVRLGITVSY